jgi:hypothetical protein
MTRHFNLQHSSLDALHIWPHLGQKLEYENRKQWMDRNLKHRQTHITSHMTITNCNAKHIL